MPKVKYHFNTHTLKYDKVVVSIWKQLLKVLGFLATAIVFAAVILFFAYKYFDSPKEKQLKNEIDRLTYEYENVNRQLNRLMVVANDLQERDNNIYRVIFEAEPFENNWSPSGTKYNNLDEFNNSELMKNTLTKLDKINHQMAAQSKSFDQVFSLAKNKSQMLASIPAIQPIANKNLKMLASGFGYRIDPVYKTVKMHTGMDFTANTGTPIYATGDGIASAEYEGGRGYGNHVVINHGYGYETLYGHMSRVVIRNGQQVKRGEVIGYVGSTGKSVGPHLHYEVIKNGVKINPVNFYYSDLTPAEYEKMREISSQANQSFD